VRSNDEQGMPPAKDLIRRVNDWGTRPVIVKCNGQLFGLGSAFPGAIVRPMLDQTC
jgi:hypothetical protein